MIEPSYAPTANANAPTKSQRSILLPAGVLCRRCLVSLSLVYIVDERGMGCSKHRLQLLSLTCEIQSDQPI